MYKHDIFISYASESRNKAICMENLLKAHGLSVFLDINFIKWGDNILKKIEDGLKQSKGYLLIIDTNYLKKGWPLFEKDAVMSQFIKNYTTNGKHIFAILADDLALKKWKESPFTDFISGHEWTDDPIEQKEMIFQIVEKLRS